MRFSRSSFRPPNEPAARVPLQWATTQKNLGMRSKARRAGERDGAARGGRRRLSRALAGKHPRARAARMGHDPDQSRHCAQSARRAGERDGAARGGRCRLSRGLAGKNPRARAARLGQTDPDLAESGWIAATIRCCRRRPLAPSLGARESGTARLEEAVSAYREALQENTRARVRLEWARAPAIKGSP